MDFGSITGLSNLGNIATLGASALSLGGSIYATNEAEKEAQANREFQEGARATQYQTAVADLKAAGLNPMLAYQQGGAGNLSGSVANIAGGNPGASAIEGATSAAGISQAMANASLASANADKARAEQKEIEARTPTYAVSMDQMRANIDRTREDINNLIQQQKTGAASAAQMLQQTENLKALIPQIQATVAQLRAQTTVNYAEAKRLGAATNLTEAQWSEAQQRIKQNLPALEAAFTDLRRQSELAKLPGLQAGAEAASSIGYASRVLDALNPLKGFFK